MFNSHSTYFHLQLNKELSEMYISLALRTLALSMIGLFVPLFFINELNYNLDRVIYYYLAWAVSFGIFSLAIIKFACKFGLKKSIFVSAPLDILSLALLLTLKSGSVHYLIPAFTLGLANSFYWNSYHLDFAKSSDKKKRGTEVGGMFSISLLFSVLGPFLGALILESLGFNSLFFVVSALLLLSVVPLFFSKDIHEEVEFKFKDLLHVGDFRSFLGFVGIGIRLTVLTVFWPIFVFLNLSAYLSLGIIFTGSGLLSSLFTFFIGRMSDKQDKRKLLRIGAFIHSITFFFRGFVHSFVGLFFVDIMGSLSGILADVPTTALFYDRANKSNRPEYVIYREVGLSAGRIILLLVVLITGNLVGGFVLGGLGSLLWMLY